MKKILYNIVDYLFYNFFVNILEENFRITIFLRSGDFNKEISMNYVPSSGSFIQLENGTFEIVKVTHAMFGSVAYLDGNLQKK